MNGIKRTITASVEDYLSFFPCLTILGARQVGKSTLLKNIFPKHKIFDLEKSSDFELISRDIEFFLNTQHEPILIDEAQLLPDLFPNLRVYIDQKRALKGRIVLTGSSSPELLNNISESLAGRVGILELNTLSLHEAFESPVHSILIDCFSKKDINLSLFNHKKYSFDQLLQKCFYGGYPEPFLNRKTPLFFEKWMENYFSTYINRDIRQLFPRLNSHIFQRFVKMISFTSSKLTNYADFSKSLDVSQPTIKSYFDIIEGTFIWRRLPSFEGNVKKRLIKTPKGHIRDSGLLCYLSNIHSIDELTSHPQFGFIWEGFMIEEIINSLSFSNKRAHFYHFRTQHKAEIDLIIEINNTFIPIEIKTGSSIKKNQLFTLKEFIKAHNSPFAIVINMSDSVEELAENIFQIPASFI